MKPLATALCDVKFCVSQSEARRAIADGRIKVNGVVVREPFNIQVKSGDILQRGHQEPRAFTESADDADPTRTQS